MSDPAIRIYTNEHQPLVTIHEDGTLTYGEGYTPDVAAKAFFDALAENFADRMDARWSAGFEQGYEQGKKEKPSE